MVVEFWVMRVLLHPGPMRRQLKLKDLGPDDMRAYLEHVQRGELTCLPDGCIAEPMEQFKTELDAHAERERLARDKPSEDYRVILNSSLDNGEAA
jgi:hypothetical protein